MTPHTQEARHPMFGLDTKSVVVGAVLGFFIGPVVVGKIRQVTGK